jgi:hypothetical protein
MRASLLAILFLAVLTLADHARAACTNPAGPEGQQVYNVTYKTMQFCDGANWIAMGGNGTVIPADTILESMLKAVNAPTDEYCLTYEATVGDFEWQTCGSGGDNLGNHTATTNINLGANYISRAGTAAGLSFDASNNATLSGDLTISGDDLFMATNTAGRVLIADGTNFNPTAVTGDITVTGAGVTAIGADKVTEAMLKAVNAATDEYCLTYETTTGDFEWQSCGGGGATLNGITAATANQAGINNAGYTIQWNWNSLAGGSALKLASTSTAAASNAQKMLEISLAGANATAGQSTFGIYAANTHTGATSSNYGISGLADGGTFANYGVAGLTPSTVNSSAGVVGRATGTTGTVYGVYAGTDSTSADAAGVYAFSSGGYGVYGTNASTTGYGGYFTNDNGGYALATGTGNVGIGVATPISLLQVASTGYAQFEKTFAGAPTGTDCDAAAELGRVTVDTTNGRWYVCTGTGGWKYTTIGTSGGAGDNLGNHTASANITLGAYSISRTGSSGGAGLSFDTSDNAVLSGDLTVTGNDIVMGTNTAAMLLIADGTNFSPTALTGDVTIDNALASKIGDNKILEAMLKAVDAPTDEECLTYETTTGDFEWQACGGGGPTIYNAGSSTTINWANGTQQYTTANCGAFTFSNMVDGGDYTLSVRGSTSGTCSFSHSGLTFRMPPGHTSSLASTYTLYAFARMGTVVHVSWMRGV